MAQSMFSGSTSLEIIDDEWDDVTLTNVADGSLASMLDCFNKKWPTWMLKAAVKTMRKGVVGRDTYENEQISVRNMPKNGFVSVDWWGNAERHEFMRACYWRRANGNRLLAIYFGGPEYDPALHFACFYDYDPKNHTLTPEPKIVDGFRATTDTKYWYDLPEEGKEMRVTESGPDGHFIYTFGWDGMKPVLKKSERMPDELDTEHNDEEEEDE